MNALVILTLAVAGLLAVNPVHSQDSRESPTRTTVKPASATTADGRFTPAFQRALESDRPEQARALLLPAVQKVRARASTKPSSALDIAAANGGLGYVCNSGNCACAGADDCVTMIAADRVCAEGTVGCNDFGCTCQGK